MTSPLISTPWPHPSTTIPPHPCHRAQGLTKLLAGAACLLMLDKDRMPLRGGALHTGCFLLLLGLLFVRARYSPDISATANHSALLALVVAGFLIGKLAGAATVLAVNGYDGSNLNSFHEVGALSGIGEYDAQGQIQNVHGMPQIIQTKRGFATLGNRNKQTQDCPTELRKESLWPHAE